MNTPDQNVFTLDTAFQRRWEMHLIKNDVYKALEKARDDKIIGKSLEARVYLNLMEEDKKTLKPILSNLKQLLIVSDVVISADDLEKYDYCRVLISKFDGERCERCWNIFDSKDLTDSLCPRCLDVVKED